MRPRDLLALCSKEGGASLSAEEIDRACSKHLRDRVGVERLRAMLAKLELASTDPSVLVTQQGKDANADRAAKALQLGTDKAVCAWLRAEIERCGRIDRMATELMGNLSDAFDADPDAGQIDVARRASRGLETIVVREALKRLLDERGRRYKPVANALRMILRARSIVDKAGGDQAVAEAVNIIGLGPLTVDSGASAVDTSG